MMNSCLFGNLFKRFGLFLVGFLLFANVMAKEVTPIGTISVGELPQAAQQTLRLVKQGGPFPFAKDGAVFGNYEGLLPKRKRGYYHEFTVRTPGARNRGARRIIAGGEPARSGEYYYTDDHYATFRRVKE